MNLDKATGNSPVGGGCEKILPHQSYVITTFI